MVSNIKDPARRSSRSGLFAIKKTVYSPLPKIPFQRIARAILGPHYELSLVICGDSLARKMNRTYRKKAYAANVLSFPLEAREGEILLNVAAAAREAKKFKTSLHARLMLLFVHGCLHLKGMRHGAKMDELEETMLGKFA